MAKEPGVPEEEAQGAETTVEPGVSSKCEYFELSPQKPNTAPPHDLCSLTESAAKTSDARLAQPSDRYSRAAQGQPMTLGSNIHTRNSPIDHVARACGRGGVRESRLHNSIFGDCEPTYRTLADDTRCAPLRYQGLVGKSPRVSDPRSPRVKLTLHT